MTQAVFLVQPVQKKVKKIWHEHNTSKGIGKKEEEKSSKQKARSSIACAPFLNPALFIAAAVIVAPHPGPWLEVGWTVGSLVGWLPEWLAGQSVAPVAQSLARQERSAVLAESAAVAIVFDGAAVVAPVEADAVLEWIEWRVVLEMLEAAAAVPAEVTVVVAAAAASVVAFVASAYPALALERECPWACGRGVVVVAPLAYMRSPTCLSIDHSSRHGYA